MAFPMLLLALLIDAVLGSGLQNVIIALAVATLPGYARVMHGLTLSVRENDYILAEKADGAGSRRIMLNHILPNALPPMIVLVTLQLGTVILAEAGLSFLGIGIRPPGAAWGSMVYDGYRFLFESRSLFCSRPSDYAGRFCLQHGGRRCEGCTRPQVKRPPLELPL